MSRKVRKYTNEFKEEAVQFALKSPSVLKTATELGIPGPTLNRWVKQVGRTSGKANPSWQTHCDVSKLLEENRRLNKELARVKEEKEILVNPN